MVRMRIEHNGQVYYSVGGAAKVLHTNTAKVKQLMGDGTLEWSNLKTNGPLYISATSVAAYQQKQIQQKRVAWEKAKVSRERSK